MNTSEIIAAVLNVGIAYLAIKNTSSLTTAIVAYFVAIVVASYVMSATMGPAPPGMSPISLVSAVAVVGIFYMKYSITGALASIVAPFVLNMAMVALGL